jgi:hypothetical protein
LVVLSFLGIKVSTYRFIRSRSFPKQTCSMETIYRVSTLKTLIYQSSRDDRLRIQTFYMAGWSINNIIFQLNFSCCQVLYTLEHQLTS